MSIDPTAHYPQRVVVERALALKSNRSYLAETHEELAGLYQALVDNESLRHTALVAENRLEQRS